MSNHKGRSVRLFLVDGDSSGLVTAEIVNWTGHVLTGPGARSGLTALLNRPELDGPGVYFLTGHADDDPDRTMVYVGESNNVRARLKHHLWKDKFTFWDRSCVVTGKDLNLTKTHVNYLEARLIAIAANAGRAALANGTAPEPVRLPEADRADMEYFIEQIRLILPVLGYDFLRERPKAGKRKSEQIVAEPDSQLMLCDDNARYQYDGTASSGDTTEALHSFTLESKKHGLRAEAEEIGNEFVVLEGSLALAEWQQPGSTAHTYHRLHERLLKEGKLAPQGGGPLARFTEDVPFSSPSAASAVIYGRTDNGRKSWRVSGTDMTYADWQEKLVANRTPDDDVEAEEVAS